MAGYRLSPRAICLLLVLIPAAAAVAQPPNVSVWFEAVPASPAAGVISQGAAGSDLKLSCDTSPGPVVCAWDLTMQMHWQSVLPLMVISSAGTDFLGNTDKHAISNLQPGNYPWAGTNLQAINAGGLLAATRAVYGPFPPIDLPAVDYSVLTARLTTTKSGGDSVVDGIGMRVNSLLWTFVYNSTTAGPTPPAALVQFGDAPTIPGGLAGALADDVIVIHNVPEPATLALFGLLGLSPIARGRARPRR
ncbi:MAG: hypothetical protein U1A27_12185 [Phycisphaerae bacterium]